LEPNGSFRPKADIGELELNDEKGWEERLKKIGKAKRGNAE